MKKRIACFICLCLCFSACAAKPTDMDSSASKSPAPPASSMPATPAAAPTAAEADLDLMADVQLQVEDLSVRLLQNAMSEDTSGNTVFSPCGLGLSFAALYLGSAGETAEQLRSTAGFTAEAQDVLSALGPLQEQGDAAALAVSQRYKAAPAFASAMQAAGIGLMSLPFGAPEALDALNAWAAARDETLSAAFTATMPSNALYMLLSAAPTLAFDRPFAAQEIYESLFESPDGLVPCRFLYTEDDLPYYEDERVQIAALPLAGGEKELLLILPAEGPLADVLENIGQYAPQWLSGEELKSYPVRLSLPEVSIQGAFSLKEALLPLGLRLPFDQTAADFSPMLETEMPFSVSEVYSLCRLQIGPAGVNLVGSVPDTADFAPGETGTDLVLDRPFLLAVRDAQSGWIELLAWINTPN